MINLLQIEFIKLKSNKSFWVISLFYCLVSYYIVNQANGLPAGSELFEKPLDFPMIWLTSTYCASFLIVFPSILIILNIGNEYKYRTSRQHVIDGLSRTKFVMSKFLAIWLIATTLTCYIILLSVFLGWKSTGSMDHFFGEQCSFIIGFYLQLIGVLSFAFLIGLAFKRTGFSIGVFVGYYFIVEPILYWLVFKDSPVRNYLPLEIFDSLVFSPIKDNFKDLSSLNMPEFTLSMSWLSTVKAIGYIAISFLLSILVFNKRDL